MCHRLLSDRDFFPPLSSSSRGQVIFLPGRLVGYPQLPDIHDRHVLVHTYLCTSNQ